MRQEIEHLIAHGELSAALAQIDAFLQQEHTPETNLADVSWAHRKRAQISFMRSELKAAIASAERALEAAYATTDEAETAEAENSLGIILGEDGRLAEAMQHFERSYTLLRKMVSPRLGLVLNNIGNTCLILDDLPRALRYFQEAVQAARHAGRGDSTFTSLKATALSNIGRAYQQLGRPDRAMPYLQQSADIYRNAGMETFYLHSLAKLAAAHESAMNPDEAERLYRQAIASSEARADETWVYEVHGSLGTLLASQGRYEEAAPQLEAAIHAASRSEGAMSLPRWRRSHASVLKARGELSLAYSEMQQAYAELERVAERRSEAQLHQAMARLEVDRMEQENASVRQENISLSVALEQVKSLQAELEKKNEQLQQLVIRDPLTGAYNRRQLFTQLGAEVARSHRYRHPLALAILDLDRFKSINDHYGHQVGDDVLVRFCGVLHHLTRSTDSLCRYGGEEFAILMPDTTQAQALENLAKLQREVAAYDWSKTGISQPVTFSAGVASLEPIGDAESLVEQADKRLYQAKRRGRNRTVGDPEE